MSAEIYTKPSCPYCVKAKQILSEKKIAYKEFIVGQNGVTKETIEQKIGNGYQVKSVPQIFLNGKHIGGCAELIKHFQVK